jgi:hypothetical protein
VTVLLGSRDIPAVDRDGAVREAVARMKAPLDIEFLTVSHRSADSDRAERDSARDRARPAQNAPDRFRPVA